MKSRILLSLICLLVGFSSCDKSLDELNFDPTKLTDVEIRLMLPEAIVQSMHNAGGGQSRIAGIVMQQFEGIDAQQIQYTNYVLGEDAVNNYWNLGLYTGALRACKVIIDKAAEEGDATFYSGVAKILMANQYGLATSIFGDIPFTEALKGSENLNPVYDTQEIVYAGVQSMLDAGIADLGSATGYGGGDLIYGGDAAAWIATAKALKARYYLHVSKRDGGAYAQALSNAQASIASLAAQPNFTFESSETANWALAKFGIERPSTLGISGFFSDIMEGDPRKDNYMVDLGGPILDFYEGGNANLTWAQNTSTIPLISYVEVKFIEAEAIARSGADASAALTEAISASMTQAGAAGGEAYAATQGDLSGLGADAQIERIITEAYKAYYGYAFLQTWTNYRRTGHPALTPSPIGSNGFNPSGVVPRRLLYPESESQTNSANVEAARARQSGGLLDVDTWANQ